MRGLLESILDIGRPFSRRGRVSAGVHPESMGGWMDSWMGASKVAGVEMDEWKMLSLSTVWACVNAISADVAKLPMHLYRRREPAGREKAITHPAYKLLLRQPNPEMTALTIKQTLLQKALRWGNGYGEIVANGAGHPIAIWPLKSQQMRLARTKDGELLYVYTDDAGKEHPFRQDKIFHIRGMGEGVMGYSVVRWGMRSLGVAAAAEEFAAATWDNQAVPPIALRHPGKLTATAQENVAKSWKETYGGVENAGRAAILPEGMTVEKLAMNNTEAQFLESRKFSVAEICRWFRFPPHMAGDLDRATFSNIEHMSLQYVQNCLMTWLEAFEQEADRKLLTEEEQDEYYFEHVTDALLRGDAKSRSEFMGQMLNNGVLTINEARDMSNLNPVATDLGEVLRVPVNTAPLDRWLGGDVALPPDPSAPDAPVDTPADSPPSDPPAPDPNTAARFSEAVGVVFGYSIQQHLEAYQRLESDKARRADAKHQLAEWTRTFYPEHQQRVHADMLGIVEHARNAARVFAGIRTLDIDCAAAARELADMHIGRSLADLASAGSTVDQVVAKWNEARAIEQAGKMFESLWKHLEPAISRSKACR